MAMEKSNTSTRVAMVLMCGLAICCAVMYMTADGNEEVHIDVPDKNPAPATSVNSEDVLKSGMIITETPDGRMRLTKYLGNVEAEIAAEEAARKKDVAEVRAQMARNFAFNKAARAKLEKAMLAKMAANAKKAKDDLARAMRFVQNKFNQAAALQNKRNTANLKRSAKLRDTIAANKAEAQKNLEHQVLVQQRAMSTLASATNARIDQTNKHVAMNAAQIKENAKKARDELDAAVDKFNQKAAAAQTEAANGRSKLQAQLQSQDKATRAYANTKLLKVVAQTAQQFDKTRTKMADDRHHADLALSQASTRMSASLNAYTALNDKRFKQTVADIEAAKREADERIAAAETSFKTSVMKLTATVEQQTSKVNARIDQLTNTVDKAKVQQAKVNAHVNAELKRMLKVGQDRYAEHMAKDAELKALIEHNQEATEQRMLKMTEHYMMELSAVRATLKKNRAHATKMLSLQTGKLYAAIAKGQQEQLATNEQLAEQTRRARLDIADALRDAKTDFANRLGALHKTVVANDKKFEGKMFKLTGVVHANAVKSAQGRQELKDIMDANKEELNSAVRDAIHHGEQVMAQKEAFLVNLNKKTKDALNMKITTEISNLRKRAHGQIENLHLQSKEARAEMRKELLFAIRSMAEEAKGNLVAAKNAMEAKFDEAEKKEVEAAAAAAEDREAIDEQIKDMKEQAAQELDDAVATMHRSMLALKYETEEKIKKTNTKVDAYAAQLKKEVEEVSGLMKAQMATLTAAVEEQEKAARGSIKSASVEAEERHQDTMTAIVDEFKKAEEASDKKFSRVYLDMADQRAELDNQLAAAVTTMNDAMASEFALQDVRFSKTVNDLAAAKAEAKLAVKNARMEFGTGLAALSEQVIQMDAVLTSQVQKVAGELISHQAAQARINRHVKAEIKRVEELMNDNYSKSIRARGKLRNIMNEYKEEAHNLVVELDNYFQTNVGKIEKRAHDDAEEAADNLREATALAFETMAKAQEKNIYAQEDSERRINTYDAESKKAIADAKEAFGLRLDDMERVIVANHEHVKGEFEKLTGLIDSEMKTDKLDRDLIRTQRQMYEVQMRGAIQTAIQEGEAKAKAVEDRARANLSAAKQSMLIEISNAVENMADLVFKTVQEKTSVIADNYLSLKAYASVASNDVMNMVAHGKGKTLSSMGDLLMGAAELADVEPAEVAFFTQAESISSLFSGDAVKLDSSVTRVNGLVNEYTGLFQTSLAKYPMGLGKYLLLKMDRSMREKGILKVDKIQGKPGNHVMVDAHTLGMSHKMDTFETLAIKMHHYEAALAAMTAKLSGVTGGKLPGGGEKPVRVPPPEWDGN